MSINSAEILQTFSWFVGNSLDRSVLPRQKHDAARKPHANRRDFMRCVQSDVRMGHCAHRRVSERNRRKAAALSAEMEQGSGRSFRRQAETETSGLCDDEPPRAK